MLLLLLVPATGVSAFEQAAPVIRICFNYDCNRMADVQPAAGEWQAVVNQFTPTARSAVEERDMIRRAIAMLEYIAGLQTPTHHDRGRNAIPADMYGQMDCIDESTNTASYLALLETHGLLRWHHVAERVRRAPHLIDVHWAGQIIETDTQDRYAVDSWHLDNGEMPYIQALNDWLRKEPVEQ